MSAGVRLLIERAGQAHLGVGPSVALLGGATLFLVSLIGTRVVTIGGQHRLGVSLKLFAAALVVALLAAQSLLSLLALAGGLALVLGSIVVVERTLLAPSL